MPFVLKRRLVPRAVFISTAFAIAAGVGCVDPDEKPIVPDPAPLFTKTAGEVRQLASQHTGSLKLKPVIGPKNIDRFIKDHDAATRLGKALFWDQQVGSDGQACATCHFHAGTDNRTKNQLNPGFRNANAGIDPRAFNDTTGFGPNANAFGPNYDLVAADFPFHKLADPSDRNSTVLSDTNEVVSSQGVFTARFGGVGAPNDIGVPSLLGNGAVFNVDGALTRNVEPRQTPSVINAALNHRNFWDGRARFEFNGVNPIGKLDPGARIVERAGSSFPELVSVDVERSALASQADGPPLSDLEASYEGRRFPDIGRKLLDATLTPLGGQLVDPTDSVLGSLSAAPAQGIQKRYEELIKVSFDARWWDVPGFVVDVSGVTPSLKKQAAPVGPDQYTVLEYNFSLFFGLAVQAYEQTLISDDAPFDRFMDGDDNALTATEQEGLALFVDKGKCVNCHGGAELTNASLANVRNDQIIERMIMGDNRVAVYDNGFYNIGVRPTLEDIGVGGTIGPLNLPLSNSRLFQRDLRNLVPQLMGANPALSLDDAIRLANVMAKIPRIAARPDEAERLLGSAVPSALAELEAARDAIASAIAGMIGNDTFPNPTAPPTCTTKAAANAQLAQVQTLLARATQAQTASAATPKLVEAATLLGALASCVCVDAAARIEKARSLLAAGVSLLPDPIDPGPDPDHPLGPPLRPEERVAVDGALKTPSLRNVSETAPYFHNGGHATLEQAVAFYNRGADFARENKDNLDPDIQPLGLTAHEQAALVAFLRALTDERVRFERAPFDHPSVSVPNGGTAPFVGPYFPNQRVFEDRFTVPSVGATGSTIVLGTPNTPYGHFLQPLH
jgi:cytochrome c peroxidase